MRAPVTKGAHYFLSKGEQEELIRKLLNRSSIRVKIDQGRRCIGFHILGALANIPSLKNSRYKHVNHRTECKIKALHLLLERLKAENPAMRLPFFGAGEQVFVVVVNGKRNRKFDLIGPLETVQDLLEPASKIVGQKRKRARGWGWGIIQDDAQIMPQPFRGVVAGETVIEVMPLSQAGEMLVQLVQRVSIPGLDVMVEM